MEVSERFSTKLQESNHQTIPIDTEDALLSLLKSGSVAPHLLILDLSIADQAVNLIREIRTLETSIPILVCSGSIRSANEIKQLDLVGINAYINEHCHPEDIVPAVSPRLFPDNFDRRISIRMIVNLPVVYRFGDTIATAPTLNISKGGLALRTLNPLEKSTRVHVRLRLPGRHADIEAHSRVVWSDLKAGMGLQFEQVEPQHQSAIDEFIDLKTREDGTSE